MPVTERERSRHDSKENKDSGAAGKAAVAGERSTGRRLGSVCEAPAAPQGPELQRGVQRGSRGAGIAASARHLPGTSILPA